MNSLFPSHVLLHVGSELALEPGSDSVKILILKTITIKNQRGNKAEM